MRIVLTGSNGQLGQSLLDRFPTHWGVFAFDSSELNITDYNSVQDKVIHLSPDVIINAAAYTAVDKAEDEPQLAKNVNVIGTKNLAQSAKRVGARFIHISTDYVFDGKSVTPYLETDTTNPKSVYGQTKLEGELVAQQILDDVLIFRTAWVFSEHGNNFYKTMLRLFAERDVLSVVADQIGKPTYAGDLANAIIHSIIKEIPPGVYHYSGDNVVSWFEFAKFIYEQFNSLSGKQIKLQAITSNAYPQKAKRPSYSVLNNQKIISFGVLSSNWQDAVKRIIRNDYD
ncbi:dTDP-4-dehydrorhamnose reductase [Thorsellia anophelis]|uniref:dTDP-4-dehydrorhamnose reductase n=1 Tax=Thorsellia anophelis DSM 18579 TaxID=1123402 RepID=A0A1I0FEM8_9GAMM|nr:dTDP-4-dehydrorhamnose reductase [Thorsellia anophelis]SET56634.1 dTDP-4-dehydrorhamnose reductase [Thorsellia anophelis DSM 18579]